MTISMIKKIFLFQSTGIQTLFPVKGINFGISNLKTKFERKMSRLINTKHTIIDI